MSKSTKRFIYKFGGLLIFIITCFSIVYFIIIDKEQHDIEIEKSITEYFNTKYKDKNMPSYSPIYGLLNYNFTDASKISTSALIYSNMMYNSQMINSDIDKIYKEQYGASKAQYESSAFYVADPTMNCYYNEKVLKKVNLNCDKICSEDTNTIMAEIAEKLGWDNVLPGDAKTYCLGTITYYTNDNIYIDLNKLKILYRNITNSNINFDTLITSKDEYKYNAYILEKNKRFDNYIIKIKDVDVVSNEDNLITAYYVGVREKGDEIKGKFVLQKNSIGYFIIENSVETGYYIK